ncbi:MAG: hypothetical protein LQ351_001377 [Letrouitia transgressa]|nr:MAG: hypothetical protein LQ351_001377 [Letrouitia transgressa]
MAPSSSPPPTQRLEQQHDSPSPRPCPHPIDPPTWTEAHETRLLHVQAQLKAAQAAWSEEQELWIDEVVHLENLKRKHLKAQKRADRERAERERRISRNNSTSSTLFRPQTWGPGGGAPDGECNGNGKGEGEGWGGIGSFIWRRVRTRRKTFAQGDSRRGSEVVRGGGGSGGKGLLRRWSSVGGKK